MLDNFSRARYAHLYLSLLFFCYVNLELEIAYFGEIVLNQRADFLELCEST